MIYGPKSLSSHPTMSSDGQLLTSSEDIKARWMEHFSTLLNQPAIANIQVLDDFEQQPVNHNLGMEPTKAEVVESIKRTKCNRSPGPDGIPPVTLKS